MDIPVRYYTTARQLFGRKDEIIILEPGTSVNDLLDHLFRTRLTGMRFHVPTPEDMKKRILVFVNEAQTSDTELMLKEGDRVSLFGVIPGE